MDECARYAMESAMSRRYRIGIRVRDGDWFWEQVYQGVCQRARELDLTLVDLDDVMDHPSTFPREALIDWLEQQRDGLDALLVSSVRNPAWYPILDCGLPIVSFTETALHHPYLINVHGLQQLAYELGKIVAARLNGRGHVLLVGGLIDPGEAGRSRLAGLRQAFEPYPDLQVEHVPSIWSYADAYAYVYPVLQRLSTPLDAIIGLNDPLALATRDAAAASGRLHAQTVVVGMGGYPVAKAALKDGSLQVSADLFPAQFGRQGMDAALHMLHHGPSTDLACPWRIITVQDVQDELEDGNEADAQQKRQLNEEQVCQVINHLTGEILERSQLLYGITVLLRANYGYDHVQIYRWLVENERLLLEPSYQEHVVEVLYGEDNADPVLVAVRQKVPIVISDVQQRTIFSPDPRWPRVRTRVLIPVFLGKRLIGLLDLHSYYVRPHSLTDIRMLEHIVRQIGLSMRQADLYHDALQAKAVALDALKKAEQADHLKTRLLANVSHELRAPLHAILSHNETALQELAAIHAEAVPLEHVEDALRHISTNAQHLVRLINDLLDLSRAEIDELAISQELIPTRAFLSNVFMSVAQSQGEQRAVAWKLQLPAQLPLVEADPVRLRQILFNLLDNARKFTTAGEITLGAEVLPPHLHLWVQDTGCGIPQEQQERIFEPFVSLARNRRPEGVGLGLAITRRLVALHHGTLTLESQPGTGSTFHIYLRLPNLDGELEYSSPALTGVLTKPVNGQTFIAMIEAMNPLKAAGPILIVDDDPQVRELSRSQVAQVFPHHRIVTVEGGAAALKIISEQVPSLVILDLTMPEVDGFAVLEALRSQTRTCKVPVLVLSGRTLLAEDAQRLNHARVVFQSKDVLSNAELIALLQRTQTEPGLAPQSSLLAKQFIAYVHTQYAQPFSMAQIAALLSVSERHLYRLVQHELGLSPREYLNRYRIKQAKELLQKTPKSVAEISELVGFDDPGYFSRVFRQHTGLSPRAYREQVPC